MSTEIKWKVTKEEQKFITEIAVRGCLLYAQYDILIMKQDIEMDLKACHNNGCPLDFYKMTKADNATLLHDLNGINFHLNRDTGKIEHHFLPRCSRKMGILR